MKFRKKIFLILVIFFCLLPITVNAKTDLTLHLFYRDGCPHCKNEKEFLETIKEDYPNLEIKLYEVSNDEENRALLKKVTEQNNLEYNGVPFTIIGETNFVGYNKDIGYKIKCTLNYYKDKEYNDIVDIALGKEQYKDFGDEFDAKSCMYNLPLIGEVNPKDVSLPLISIVIGLVDGFNPCAMWVLIFLISMLMGMKDRKRMWALGITFLASSALVYLLFMLVWINLTSLVFEVNFVRILIALVALIGGIINLRSFYIDLKQKDVGCTVTNKEQKKKIIDKIKKIVGEKSFIIALIGVILLAVSVNIVELACSAGLPVIFSQILSLNDLSLIETILYVTIYIIFFLIDDLVVFIIAMTTLKLTGISNKYTKYSHLIGGLIMLIIGLLLIINPGLLTFG